MSKKKPNQYTTSKQKQYAIELVENGGNKYKAAKAAGYSDSVALDAKKKIESRQGFQDLIDAIISNEKVLHHILDGLDATDKFGNPDHNIRHKFIDMFLKIKGAYAPVKQEVTEVINHSSILDELENTIDVNYKESDNES